MHHDLSIQFETSSNCHQPRATQHTTKNVLGGLTFFLLAVLTLLLACTTLTEQERMQIE